MAHDTTDQLLKRNALPDSPDFARHIIEQSKKITHVKPMPARRKSSWFDQFGQFIDDLTRPVIQKPVYALAVVAVFALALGVMIDTSGLDIFGAQTAQFDDTDMLFYELMNVS